MASPQTVPGQNADRNLFFGVLALQMDFITREELVAATSAWVLAKKRGLDQILLQYELLGWGARTSLYMARNRGNQRLV